MDNVIEGSLGQWNWLGNLYEVLPVHLAILLVMTAAIAAGFVLGAEREFRRKSAGLRTMALVSVGSCIFTVTSLLLARAGADPGRAAAAVAAGIGFLGAGVILHERSGVSGLTTGATIWTTAALGVLAGAGFAAAAVVISVVIVTMLLGVGLLEERMRKHCRFVPCRVHYKRERGKARVQLLQVLDQFGIPDRNWSVTVNEDTDTESIELQYCHYHAEHRAVLYGIVAIPAVKEIDRKRAARDAHTGSGSLADIGTQAL